MKRLMFVGSAVLLSCLALSVRAQDSKSDDQSAYKLLAKEEGVWDADIKMMAPGTDGKIEATTSKGVETNRMMAGKWLISDFKGEMFGSTFEGHGTYGYDAKKNKYVATWVDTMSVRIDALEGTYDEKTKTLTLNSDSESPDGKPMKMRLETQFNDDGTRTFSLWRKQTARRNSPRGWRSSTRSGRTEFHAANTASDPRQISKGQRRRPYQVLAELNELKTQRRSRQVPHPAPSVTSAG